VIGEDGAQGGSVRPTGGTRARCGRTSDQRA
jgi:hypothetical protein